MARRPTLQSLAVRARDYFDEDGQPFDESVPSTLDVVIAAYASSMEGESVVDRARTVLRRHLEKRGTTAAQGQIDEFVVAAIGYLRAIDPNVRLLSDDDERRLLSHLFWGHLVESRHALGGDREVTVSTLPSLASPATSHTITCSCGEELTTEDEGEIYTFIRAHAAQQHSAPAGPVYSETVPNVAETRTPEVAIGR